MEMPTTSLNERTILKVTSLINLVLITIHFSDDLARGIDRAGPQNAGGIAILLVWLYGTVMLAGRAGLVVMLLAGVFALGMPIIHMRGARFPAIVASSGGIWFVTILYVLGTLGAFAVILAIRGLLNRSRP